MPVTPQRPKHIVHRLFRFAACGLEDVVVQLVNCLQHNPCTQTVPQAKRLLLAVLGVEPLAVQVIQTMADLGLQYRLWLPGLRADVPSVLHALAGLRLPSLSAGTSCTLQESMAYGVSMVTTDVGGINQDLSVSNGYQSFL